MGSQKDNASGFEMTNHQDPRQHFHAFHTTMKVPTPTNSAAKEVHASQVIRAVTEGK